MAEVIGLGASIVGIAGAGIATVTALTKFGISYRGSDNKIDDLAARVSLTATILHSTGEIIEEHERFFKRKEFLSTWNEVLKSCDQNYERLNDALAKAKSAKRDEAKGSKIPQLSTWFKLKWALGGDEKMKELEASLEKACQQVMMMQQVVQLTAISVVAKRQEPTKKEVDERRELMEKMDWILTGLSKSGILAIGPASPNVAAASVKGINPTVVEKEGVTQSTTTTGISSSSNIHLISFKRDTIPSDPTREQDNGPFEAYYIVPRSLSRNSPKGSLHIIRQGSQDYMAVAIDPRSLEPNYRHAIARAPVERITYDPQEQQDQIAVMISKIPDSAAKEIMWLIEDRLSGPEDNHCDWIDIQELSFTQTASTLLGVHTFAYLVVMRCKPDKSRAILPSQGRFDTQGSTLARHTSEYPETEISIALKKRALEKELARIAESHAAEDMKLCQALEEEKSKMENESQVLGEEEAQKWVEWDRKMLGHEFSTEQLVQMQVEFAQDREKLNQELQSVRASWEERLRQIEGERDQKGEEMRGLVREKEEEMRQLGAASRLLLQDSAPLPQQQSPQEQDSREYFQSHQRSYQRKIWSSAHQSPSRPQGNLSQLWDTPTTVLESEETSTNNGEVARSNAAAKASIMERQTARVSMEAYQACMMELAKIRQEFTANDLAVVHQSKELKIEAEKKEHELDALKNLHLQEVDKRLRRQESSAQHGTGQKEPDNSEYYQKVDELELEIMEIKSRRRHVEDRGAHMRQKLKDEIQRKEEELVRLCDDIAQDQSPVMMQEAPVAAQEAPMEDLKPPIEQKAQYSKPLQGEKANGSKQEPNKVSGVDYKKGRSRLRDLFGKGKKAATMSMDAAPLDSHSFRRRNTYSERKDSRSNVRPSVQELLPFRSATQISRPHQQPSMTLPSYSIPEAGIPPTTSTGSDGDELENEKRINDFMASFSTLYEKDQ